MTSPLRHLADVLAYAGTRRSRDRHDASVLAELEAAPRIPGLPDSVEVRFLGVAGFALTCEGTTVLIDPYVTRFGLGDMVRRKVVAPDLAAIDRWVPTADAVLVGHTHFDHALDVPAIARRDGCPVYGGESLRTLMGLHGRAEQAVVVEPHRPVEVGPFTVTFVPSLHSKLALGRSIPSDGEITCEHVGALTPQAYCCGQVWGLHVEVDGATLYHQGSADLIEDEIRHTGVDAFLCGVAGRQFTDDYMARILRRLDPRTVVLCHHDDFLRRLDEPLAFTFGVDVAGVPEEVEAVSRDIGVMALPRVG